MNSFLTGNHITYLKDFSIYRCTCPTKLFQYKQITNHETRIINIWYAILNLTLHRSRWKKFFSDYWGTSSFLKILFILLWVSCDYFRTAFCPQILEHWNSNSYADYNASTQHSMHLSPSLKKNSINPLPSKSSFSSFIYYFII